MTSQLGSAQLGIAQLGSYGQLLTPSSAPSPGPTIVRIGGENVTYIVLPDYFKMMGICTW